MASLPLILAAGFIGLLIGSFLNVVAYRIPLGMKVTSPPSACPQCQSRIRTRDNIPVVSWILLRGRCRDCGAPISVRYAVVELGTAVVFGATAALIGWDWALPAYLWAVGVCIALVVTDLDHKRLPNRILYPGAVVATVLLGAGAALEGELAAWGRGLLGGVADFAFFLLIALVARGGFGFGDVKLAFLLGEMAAYRSWESLFVAVFASFMVGGLIAVGLLVARRAGRRDAMPFGPAMVIGAAIGVAWGESIASWYLG